MVHTRFPAALAWGQAPILGRGGDLLRLMEMALLRCRQMTMDEEHDELNGFQLKSVHRVWATRACGG